MSKRFFAALTLSLSCALLLAGCGSTETTTNNSNQTGTNQTSTTTTTTSTPATTTTTTPATTTTTTANTTTTTAGGDSIGVPECDDFINKYEACITGKVPETARAQWNTTLQQWRSSWKQLAANPQTRSTLAAACKMAADQSRQSMKPYGCDF